MYCRCIKECRGSKYLVLWFKGNCIMIYIVKVNVNIVFIKYWGKKDIEWNLLLIFFISLILDVFYIKIIVIYDLIFIVDILFIDDEIIIGGEYLRVIKYMDKLRKLYNIFFYVKIIFYNFVFKKVGLVFFLLVFVVFVYVVIKVYGLNLDFKEFLLFVRLGSGFVLCFIYGGLVLWYEGYDYMFFYVEYLIYMDDLVVIVCLIDEIFKKVNSIDVMNRLNEYLDLKELWILSI